MNNVQWNNKDLLYKFTKTISFHETIIYIILYRQYIWRLISNLIIGNFILQSHLDAMLREGSYGPHGCHELSRQGNPMDAGFPWKGGKMDI